jgi:hypothetical protein
MGDEVRGRRFYVGLPVCCSCPAAWPNAFAKECDAIIKCNRASNMFEARGGVFAERSKSESELRASKKGNGGEKNTEKP